MQLRGELARGDLMTNVFALYDAPAPPGMTDNPDRRAAGRAEVVEADDPAVPTEVVILERVGSDGNTFHQLPFALTPGPPIPTTALRESIEWTAAAVATGLPQLPHTAMIDMLLRRAPRTRSGAALPRGSDTVADITAAALDLDSSYLAVHGPPGTGKTYTAAHVIKRLVTEHSWRIGVVAQSHATVENLLDAVIDAGLEPTRIAKKRYDHHAPRWQEIDGSDYAAFIANSAGCVIGGTAWDFANRQSGPAGQPGSAGDRRSGPVLFGQHHRRGAGGRQSVAARRPAAVAAGQSGHSSGAGGHVRAGLAGRRSAHAARRTRLLPGPLVPDASGGLRRGLGAVLRGQAAFPHECTAARRLDGYQPGVQVLPVRHQGNSIESPEEADAIVAEIQRLLGGSWTDEHGTRPLTASDVLVLAPYNAQVALLRRAVDRPPVSAAVRVGTVDKFQGGQAPVVFISMTASSIDEVPRGISFLLNRNRLNVAVSRAQYAAVIVRSQQLTEYLPSTPAGLIDLGAFLALTEPVRADDARLGGPNRPDECRP